eukprot:327886-Amphidinium_carterae.1
MKHDMEKDSKGRGRDMLQPDPSKQNQRASMPASLFEADAGSCTLEKDFFHGMLRGTEQFFSPGPVAYLNMTCMWMTTLDLKEKFEDLGKVWLSLLATTGCMLKNKVTNKGGLVVHICSYGVVTWNMSVQSTEGDLFWDYRQSRAKRPWSYHVITNLEEWECVSCTALPPELSITRAPASMHQCPFIAVCKSGRRLS